MIRIAICDDEKKILDEVSGYIKNYAEKKSKEIEVFRFDSAASLIGTLEDGRTFDVFVLDVTSVTKWERHSPKIFGDSGSKAPSFSQRPRLSMRPRAMKWERFATL